MTRANRARMITRRLLQPPAQEREDRDQRLQSETIGLVEAVADLAATAQKLRWRIERADADDGHAWLVGGLEAGLIKALGNARGQAWRIGPDQFMFARFVERELEHIGEFTS